MVTAEATEESFAETAVLIVEDNRAIQHVLQRMLQQMGVGVVDSAYDGLEALRTVSEQRRRYGIVRTR